MNGEGVFADTSAFLALLDGSDALHMRAKEIWQSLVERQPILWTSDYVRLETWALLQRRIGNEALTDFHEVILPLCRVISVGEDGFERAADKWRLARRRKLSLVDITSFDLIRVRCIPAVFAFDKHFAEEGFSVL